MAEMKDIIMTTGGVAVQTDTYHNVVFKDSLKRLFLKEADEGFIGMSSNANLEVRRCARASPAFPQLCSRVGW